MSIRGGSGTAPSSSFLLDVARGEFGNISHVNKFGYDSDIDGTAEEVWDGGAAYSGFLTTASTISAISTSADDTASTGTGARTVTIYGLDANYAEINETLSMNGLTTTAETNQSFLRVFRAVVTTAGTGLTNAGTITFASTNPTTVAVISPAKGQTLMAIYTIPAGKTGYLSEWHTSTGKAVDITAELYARPFGGAWNIKGAMSIFQQLNRETFNPPLALAEKTDVKIMALTSTSNVACGAGFDIILVDN